MIVQSTLRFSSSVPLLISTDEKLPVKAANSIPEFFQEEFPTFQTFIDLYYQYQSQAKSGYQTISSIKDIDEVGEKYLEAFYRTYANKMPVFPYIGMADFIRNAKKFYVSRGSEDSFRFLFRIMFGVDIEFKYPQENMFKPSSGLWVQKVSIYLRVLVGDVDGTLLGKTLLIKDLTGATSTLKVKAYRELPAFPGLLGGEWVDENVWFDTDNWQDTPTVPGTVFEIEVEKFASQTVTNGAKVFALVNPTTLEYALQGEITTTLSSYEVITPGVDFRLGSVYEYNSPAGILSFRVTAIDQNKGIKRIEFLSFPSEYSSVPVDYTFSGAVIRFKANPVNRYSGYYDNSDGFLSNNSKLQDSYFYQIFSYVIKSRVSRELYEDLVNRILHPAGLIMFSEYEKLSDHILDTTTGTDVSSSLDILDPVVIYDEFDRVASFSRVFEDTIPITEEFSLLVGKTFSDTVAITESGLVSYWGVGDYAVTGYFADNFYTTSDYQSRTI
jgi:hypothetical protein